MKKYIEHNEIIFATGVFLRYNRHKRMFVATQFEDDSYYDGHLINFDKAGRPYIIINNKGEA